MIKKILYGVLSLILVFTLISCKQEHLPVDPNNPGENNGNPNNPGELVPKYNLYFYTGDKATQIDPILGKKEGEAITAPADPQLIGSKFVGWYTDYGTFENKFEFGTMPAENIILYAKWEVTISDDSKDEYEVNIEESSQNGHLYIHYMRFDNDPEEYAKMSLWVWPKAYTGRTFNWVKDANGKVQVDDVAGAVCDIDLTKFYTGAGNDETETLQFFKDGAYGTNYKPEYINDSSKYMDPDIGFLIVYDNSKNSGTHWTSDGGNQYFSISNAVRKNGSLHIFATQDNVGDFVYKLADKGEIVNPYENDDGTNVSISNVPSSTDLSATIDPTSLQATATGVGYQIMVSSFADSNGDGYGDIRGIIENIDYLKKLNIDVLWLTPIQLSDSYHGYDIIDYCSVDPKFGTLEDYKELIKLCHENKMKIVMDLVLNHTSLNNVWFQKSAKMVKEDGIDYRSFYHWRNHKKENLSSDWYAYSEYDYSYYGKFGSGMPELNYDYQPTRDAILGVAKYWLTVISETEGVDGFRIDAVKHIYMEDEVKASPTDIILKDFDSATNKDYSTNLTKNLNFFCWLISGIKKINPNAYVVGENFDGHAYRVAPYYKAFDGMLDFYMYYNLAQLQGRIEKYGSGASGAAGLAGASSGMCNVSDIAGTNLSKLYVDVWNFSGVLKTEMKYGNKVNPGLFTSNHDVQRLMNNMAGSLNSSGSDLIAGTVTQSNAAQSKKEAITVFEALMTLPGISFIYYGDEIGMSSNYNPGETATSPHVDRQYRQPFKWTTAANGSKYIANYSISGDKTYYVTWDSYNKTLPGVKEQLADNNSFLNEVMVWTKLKSTDDVIRYGDYKYKQFSNSDCLSFTRSYNGKTYWVLVNFGNTASAGPNTGKVICASKGASASTIPAGGCVVVQI